MARETLPLFEVDSTGHLHQIPIDQEADRRKAANGMTRHVRVTIEVLMTSDEIDEHNKRGKDFAEQLPKRKAAEAAAQAKAEAEAKAAAAFAAAAEAKTAKRRGGQKVVDPN